MDLAHRNIKILKIISQDTFDATQRTPAQFCDAEKNKIWASAYFTHNVPATAYLVFSILLSLAAHTAQAEVREYFLRLEIFVTLLAQSATS